jgi:hypothetical protein
MGFNDLLVSTCTVRQYSSISADAYGQPVKTYHDHLIGQLCRLSGAQAREFKVGAEVVIADAKLFIGDVDISERDQVIVDGATYEVLAVIPIKAGTIENHHKECYLRIVR